MKENDQLPLFLCSSALVFQRRVAEAARAAIALLERFKDVLEMTKDPEAVRQLTQLEVEQVQALFQYANWHKANKRAFKRAVRESNGSGNVTVTVRPPASPA